MTSKKPIISIITPCFNEEKSIENCLSAVQEVFEKHLPEYEYEHIFCDNASDDKTVKILKSHAQKNSRIKVIVNSRNYGPFRSMFNGLRRASGGAVLPFLPADLQDPPTLIPEMIKLWESGYEIVAGKRETRAEPLPLRFARNIFYRLLNWMSDFDVPHGVGEFQLLDRKVVDAVLGYESQYPFLRTMIASVGYKRVILPYHWDKRAHGKSRLSVFNLVDQAMTGFFSFNSKPLRMSIWMGFLIAVLCLAYGVYVAFIAIFGLASPPEGIFTLIMSVMFLFGVQLIFFGVLGEYISQIHRDVRGGKVVYEKEIINFDQD
ncbi:MAG: glycosyltransferase family 2 protein [Parvibaculales bacterium]